MSVANPRVDTDENTPRSSDIGLLIFARAPTPGRCKTRLARRLGNVRAARLYAAMLEHAVARVCARPETPVTLICTPDTRAPLFSRLARCYGVRRCRQARGDLGTRMAAAIRWGLMRHRRIVLMGSDQPALAGDWLSRAAVGLRDANAAWMAPTRDGGYWAIGLGRPEPRLFRGPRWSTPRVARHTRTRMRSLDLDLTLEPLREDIDEARDWHALPDDLRTRLARGATMAGLRQR